MCGRIIKKIRDMKYGFMVLALLFVVHACAQSELPDELYNPNNQIKGDTVMFVDFNKSPLGIYSEESLIKDFGDIQWALLKDRGEIVAEKDRGNVLKVLFPKGSVGPEQGGIQFLKTLPYATAYYYDCYIKFSENFDFNLGGKLPGLTSGGDKYTGGNKPVNGEGWSARYMWTDKNPVVYLYYVDMPEQYGEPLYLSVNFEKGRWYRLTQYIRVNSSDKKDAKVKVWVDGKVVLEKENFRLRCGEMGLIDSFYFSTFHGGNTPEWAPRVDCHLLIDNLMIKKSPVNFSK